MSRLEVVVVTPFDVDSGRGNSVSARRIGGIVRALGMNVRVAGNGELIPGGDVLVALHARRSWKAIEQFAKGNPGGRRVVVLTGSDLHVDLPTGGEAGATVLQSMELADVLVLAQAGSIESVPFKFREKLVVVPKSVDIELPAFDPPPRSEGVRVVIAAHLRPLKDPFRAVEALAVTAESVRVRIDHYGAADDAEVRSRAEWESALNVRYQWHGEVSRSRMVEELSRCHLHLNTALMEGGANSVCEAIRIGVPIIATRIPGNTGMLGEAYGGYFDVGDTPGLARMLRRSWEDPEYLDRLGVEVSRRSQLFTREAEMAGWRDALQGDFSFHET